MKQSHLCWSLLALLFTTSISHALTCPTNFKSVNIGDPIATVEAACGAPTSKKESPAPDNDPQEWSYFLPSQGHSNMMFQQTAPTKTTLAFDSEGRVASIVVNNVGTDSIDSCGGGSISVGSTRKEVEESCGKAVMITKSDSNRPAANDPNNKMMEYFYAGPPSATFVFIKGVLTEKR